MRFQAIQDSYNIIFNINFIIVIDIYILLKNIAKFANKLSQIVKIIKLFEDSFQNNFVKTKINKIYLNAKKSIYC